MKYISIQLQPEQKPISSKDEVLSLLTSEGFSPEIDEGDDYINFNIPTENTKEAWLKIKSSLLNKSHFIKSTIVTCEGSNGWDDYLLLHHFDESEVLDDI